jgi:hypothetical protein
MKTVMDGGIDIPGFDAVADGRNLFHFRKIHIQ